MRVALLVGTVRARRESIKAAHYIAERVKQYPEIELTFVDPQTLMFVDEGEDVKDPVYTRVTEEADAFIIVTPEYNHSFPSSLKRMLDSEYKNYEKKPVALVGVSSGNWGGVRVCEALLPVCHRLGMVNIHSELYFPKIQEMFDGEGLLKSEHQERYAASVEAMISELMWFGKLLKEGRDS